MKCIDIMEHEVSGLNLRSLLPFKFLYYFPFPVFIREKRAFQILNNVFDILLEQHKVCIYF